MGITNSFEISRKGIKMPGLSITDEGIKMPGLSITDEGIKMPGLSITDGEIKISDTNITNKEIKKSVMSVINKKNIWFDFLTNIFYPFFGFGNTRSVISTRTNNCYSTICVNGNKFVVVSKNNLIYINDIATNINCNDEQIRVNVVNGVVYINGNKIDSKKFI